MSSFTKDQNEYITKFYPAIVTKHKSCTPVEMTDYKKQIRAYILQNPLFQGVDNQAGDRIWKNFTNAISRKSNLVEYRPLSGIGLFEQENKAAIVVEAEARESKGSDDQAFQLAKQDMWSALEEQSKNDYEMRAAALGNTFEAWVPVTFESGLVDDFV
ncbi:hypothetical protein FB45DRAFT_1062503 [Roridomyces roridus]|uniref:Uncharacterized protein n=1 Tax=Roridomyces roridus TaxID=1738132 RepID=A0AAD7BG68_9AGAR|nr:hypothetical protein FB45DRAFT_1062503 [Roridomyces roridus]